VESAEKWIASPLFSTESDLPTRYAPKQPLQALLAWSLAGLAGVFFIPFLNLIFHQRSATIGGLCTLQAPLSYSLFQLGTSAPISTYHQLQLTCKTLKKTHPATKAVTMVTTANAQYCTPSSPRQCNLVTVSRFQKFLCNNGRERAAKNGPPLRIAKLLSSSMIYACIDRVESAEKWIVSPLLSTESDLPTRYSPVVAGRQNTNHCKRY
ncbi:hypothetical protein TrispH2_011929, partial [Trichoplax sp. H2]